MKFSERLNQLLKDANISQEKLAKSIGYTQRAVSKWINKQTEPTAMAIFLCAKYFNVSSDFLLGLED